jgi:phage terminase large subunit GpA-like protein
VLSERGAYMGSFLDGLRPRERMSVWQHADKYRYLDQSSSPEPGLWRTSRVPYTRLPMELMSAHSAAKKVVLMFPTQQAKTEVAINLVQYIMDHAPAPFMIVQPTIDTAERFSKRRISSMIANSRCESIRNLGRVKSASSTILQKAFPGGFGIISGANSASSLASDPVKYLIGDEVDRWIDYLIGEGPPLDIAYKRTEAFGDAKILLVSTPTLESKSIIYAEYLKGDQCKYHLPCPHCGWKQELIFDHLVWDRSPTGKDLPETVKYMCVDCGTLISESDKTWMMSEANGAEWVPTNSEAEPHTYSFHINGLYAPLGFKRTWSTIVREHLESQENPRKLQVFVNTVLAQPFSGGGEVLDYERLFLRCEDYEQGTVPEGHYILTAAVDVQADRVEVKLMAWGPNMANAVILYRAIPGRPSDPEVERQLDDILNHEYRHESGGTVRVRLMLVDAGYNAHDVYQYCLRHSPTKVMAIRGRDNLQTALVPPKRIDYKRDGVTIFRGVTIQNIGVNILKEEVYNWLRQPLPDEDQPKPRGWSRWPKLGQDFFKGLCSEQLVSKIVRGRQSWTWEKIPGRERNEPWDLFVYNLAAATSLGLYQWDENRWRQEEIAVKQSAMSHAERVQHASSQRAQPKRRHQSSWLGR